MPTPTVERFRFLLSCVAFGALLLLIFSPGTALADSLEKDFWSRNWDAMELRAGATSSHLSPRESCLWANALWLQGRWGEAVEVLEGLDQAMPQSLRPYADMLMLLGLERTGREGAAVDFGRAFFPRAPKELRFYVAYAMARLVAEDAREPWLRRMISFAGEEGQKVLAYERLLELPGDRTRDALALLQIRSLHPRALRTVRKVPHRERSHLGAFALGYAAFLQGRFEEALRFLEDVPKGHELADRAAYYIGMAQYRKREYRQAFTTWKDLVLRGHERYASAAVRRLAIMAGKALRDSTLGLLQETADGRDDRVAKGALFHLSQKAGDGQGEAFFERLMRSYPLSDEVADLLWDRGWMAWKQDKKDEALEAWDQAIETSVGDSRRAQLLYWSGRALESLGREKEAVRRFAELRENHRRSYYFHLAFPGEDLSFSAGLPQSLRREPDILERWGFVHYARLRYLADGSMGGLWRAARLAAWSGDLVSAYRYASRVNRLIEPADLEESFCLPLMELLYPRPYVQVVRDLGKRFDTEDFLIWAIMRQESAFDPQALSWVGATGLMQLMPATAAGEARRLGVNVEDFTDPEVNLLLGVSHISWLLGHLQRLDWAIAAYNAGSGAVRRWNRERDKVAPAEWIEDIPYDETRHYVKKVLANLHIYRQIYVREQEGES